MLTVKKLHIRLFALLMLFCGVGSEAWAAKVTYHILTLPIDNSIYHMKSEVSGKRLEAVKVVVDNQSTVELPAHFKSPLVTSFTYYTSDSFTPSGPIQLYTNTNTNTKAYYYTQNVGATTVSKGTAITTSTAEYYVVYTYDEAANLGAIAKLDGSVNYNIGVKGKGFLSLNRGRNNRPAVIPTAKVDPEMLASEDFSYVANPGNNIGTYWSNTDNKNKQEDVESQFFFSFNFVGQDPYNIIVRTSYNRKTTYIEENNNLTPKQYVYKWYKEGSLFAVGTNNAFIASDEHKRYNIPYNSSIDNPTELTEGEGNGYIAREGNWHGQKSAIWGTVALLNNTSGDGYVLLGTRTVDGNGNVPTPSNNNYYYLTFDGYNNLKFGLNTAANATKNHTIDGIYPLKKVTFKIATPFYASDPSDAHVVSAPTEWVSQYTVDNDPIETKYLPASLKRKYCNYTGKFYSDAACTNEITHFSQASYDNTEGYKVYVGYNVSPAAPTFLSPSASYTTATWYELTDDGSVQESGRKIKNNSGTYKNNGANGTYEKESEFAFEGDPYELKVLYRKGTEDASSKTYVTLSTYDTWDMPSDDTAGSFLLRKYNDTGYWNWDTGHVSAAVAYGSSSTPSTDKNAQTITINLSGLNTSKYYKITTSGAGASQIVSVTPSANNVQKVTGTTLTVVVKLAENTSDPLSDQTITITFQEYDDAEGNTPFGSASNITITQGTASSSFAGNVVAYSTSNSTRVKVMTLPTRNFTYNIVDKSGRIAVKASTEQTIFSALSLASIPSIIVSPFLVGETVKFYDDAYSDNAGRGTLSSEISETPDTDHDIFVTYTTSALDAKPYKLSEDQEIFVRLNGQYIYYEGGVVKTSATSANTDNYKWKLRNRDPYNMLIDNMAARTALSVANQSESVDVYNDDGSLVDPKPTRQKGAWVTLSSITNEGTLSFTKRRTAASEGEGLYAQPFIAKSSTAMGVYEVMVATGSSVDASTTYYNIGRPTANTVLIYNNTSYAHGNEVLAFRLEQSSEYTYYLIDKAKHKLLEVNSKSPELVLPAEYQSPLVGTYNYYGEENITIIGDEYKPKDASVKIDNLDAVYIKTPGDYSSKWSAAGLTATDENDVDVKAKALKSTGHFYFRIGETSTYYDVNVTKRCHDKVYVTYEANDIVKFNTGSYMLKFLEPYTDGYYLEDGNDNLTATQIQAVYPYCNGDGNLNIYGDDMQKEQFGGGASTRPRWIWYFVSDDKDPYHVAIRSRSTISYNSIPNSTYLTTYVVHFNQDAEGVKKVVTGGTLPGIAGVDPTEYMVLGTLGNYQLLTTKEIDDGTTNERRRVTSLEQYWKTYNMIKKDVLRIDVKYDATYKDAYSDDASTWVVPEDQRATLNTQLEAIGVGSGNWHSYSAYANATRWNGYNNKESGHEKKVVESIEHWFQTFDMGNGSFDIESAEVPPVLVLLDLHGWEIMRLPLPTVNYPEGDDELAALRAYDSPMVKEYKFYFQATKASGCHKYTLRTNDSGYRDEIKVNGKAYTSTSLGDLPPITASGVKSGSAFNDQFVTYTVKEEYAKSYDYTFTDNGNGTYSESGTASKFLILLRSRFLRDNGAATSYFSKPIYEASNPVGGNVYDAILDPQRSTESNVSTNVDDNKDSYIDDINLWYLQPNLDIDKEMGIKWGTSNVITDAEPLSEYGTKKKYKDITGFDPYNIQLKNADNSKFVTSHQTSTTLHDGIMIGDYSGSGGTTNMTLETGFSYAYVDPLVSTGSEGYDHTNIKMSNQTFMAVSDANGNLQLMPRFDHTKRVNLVNNSANSFTTLQDPVTHSKASADNNASMGTQTVFFVRPQVFEYKIIDNDGNESIRYKRSGDYYPAITDHFKSPLAKDFTYYKGLATHETPVDNGTTSTHWDAATGDFKRTATTVGLMNSQINLLPTAGTYEYRVGTRGSFTYYTVEVTKGLQEKQITGSFADAGLNDKNCNVIVRYDYDTNADHDGDRILEGKWFTVKLANKDLQSSATRIETAVEATQGTGVSLYAGEATSRSLTAADADDVDTQAKKLTATGDFYFKQKDAENYWLVNVTVAYNSSTSTDATYTKTAGSYATLWSNSKPLVVDADTKKWQWKFFVAPADPTSDYYVKPDPYAIHLFNRYSNYTTNPSAEPSPMAIGIKVPNANNGADRFALLSHSEGGYALAVAGTESYTYTFVNGASMTTSVAATTATEASFTQKAGLFDGVGSQLILNDDVKYNFTYKVINNGGFDYVVDKPGYLAVSATQDNDAADAHQFFPYLPYDAQTPLLRMKDYKYYGFATKDDKETVDESDDTYKVIPQTVLYTLYGLYDDVVWVRYNKYDMDSTEFKIPNKKDVVNSIVARHPSSVDVSMNIKGELPYNIIWYNDNMMESSDDTNITYAADHNLDGTSQYVWYFTGDDPYGLKIEHKKTGYYVYSSDGSTCSLHASNYTPFMLLRKTDYDYGVLQVTGGTKKLSGYGNSLTDVDPTHFIVFGLSVHDLIYRLVIAKTCPNKAADPLPTDQYVDIPYRATESGTLTNLRIYGTTQRNLTEGSPTGATYQLGSTVAWGGDNHTYSFDAGAVSIGDVLVVPNIFFRPNCTFDFYIQDIYGSDKTTAQEGLNNKYKGLKLKNLMSDAELIDKTVVVNIVYSFDKKVATNTGLGFVTDVGQNLWYTFETPDGETPYLAQYTNAWGLQAKEGRATRYTNDYLWTPLGDVYGFKMYNRYMEKNSTPGKVMTMSAIENNQKLLLAQPSTTESPTDYPAGYEVFELLPGDMDGYFRVHPVVNTGEPKYYVRRYNDTSDVDIDNDGTSDLNYTILSTSPCDWRYGLEMELLEPYYERAGYVGGLTDEGKTAYETEIAKDVKDFKITNLQSIVYNDDNIVHYTPGYYRLHSQPGVSGIAPVRYASGYLHDIEKTAVSGGIPMHFYSKEGVSSTFNGEINPLRSGFTETHATRGDIPIAPTERDPSTIFYFNGTALTNEQIEAGLNPTSTMQTQGLYVAANPNGDSDNGTTTSKLQRAVMKAIDNPEDVGTQAITFSLMDIGGAVLLIHDGSAPATRRYLNFDQSNAADKYDLKYYHESPTDDAKWCMQPVQKTATVGNGEMPLEIATNQGGDGHYYATFYAPFDVLLPNDAGAYYCKTWDDAGLHPVAVPAATVNAVSYGEGRFVPAGTPVIIRTTDESNVVTLTLPSTSPTASSITTDLKGSYLEQLLAVDASHDVYTLGLFFTSGGISIDRETGVVTAPLVESATTGVGFYINATPNKEHNALQAQWQRNNRYVLHNRIYYRATSPGAKPRSDAPQYVPVIFDDSDIDNDDMEEQGRNERYDNHVYDLSGRMVATEQQVLDGSWTTFVAPGTYIVNGRKVRVK